MVTEVDTDGDGTIEFNEFLAFILRKLTNEYKTEEELIDAFRVFDMEGNGQISAEALKDLLANIGEKLTADELEMVVRDEDVDMNGMINYVDFVKGMMGN